jgi:hypothetical protein
MELTEKRESLQPGLAAVFFVDNAMDIGDDRGAVTCSLNLFLSWRRPGTRRPGSAAEVNM